MTTKDHRRKYNSLDDHRRAVDHAPNARKRSAARDRARAYCIALGIALPDWCAVRAPAACRPPAQARRFVRFRSEPPTPETEPTIEIEPALNALRGAWAGAGKAFALRPNGVTLIDLSECGSRRCAAFGSVDAALRAVAAGAIPWAPLAPPGAQAFT